MEAATGIGHHLSGAHLENVATDIDCYSVRQPLGVCAGICPFNFPAMVPLWMFPVAIAAGNTFVLKPSEKDPGAAMALTQLAHEAGLPPGALFAVHGDRMDGDDFRSAQQVHKAGLPPGAIGTVHGSL